MFTIYRKKATTIKAVQLTEDNIDKIARLEFASKREAGRTSYLWLSTLTGPVKCHVGDYIVKTEKEMYPIAEDEFKILYMDDPTKQPKFAVYPSREVSVQPISFDDIYGGAHQYIVKNCVGHHDGKTIYDGGTQLIQFVEKKDNGIIIPGLQSEQLILILRDRIEKLNARFPSEHNDTMLTALNTFLKASRERIDERINRNVMGELKK